MNKEKRAPKESFNLNEEKRVTNLKIKRAKKWDDQNFKKELLEDAEVYLDIDANIDENKHFGVRKGKKCKEEITNQNTNIEKVHGKNSEWYHETIKVTAAKLKEKREKETAKQQEELERKNMKLPEKHRHQNNRLQ